MLKKLETKKKEREVQERKAFRTECYFMCVVEGCFEPGQPSMIVTMDHTLYNFM